jgi:hypothetical protein
MKGSVWGVLLASFVLFLLSFGACAYGPQFERIPFESVLDDGMNVCGYDSGPSEWETLGGLLFLASVSVAAGGAMLWWRAGLVGETHVRTPLLDLDGAAAGDGEAIETAARDAAREELPAREEGAPLPEAGLTAESAPAFAHFDEHGRSPLERALAES